MIGDPSGVRTIISRPISEPRSLAPFRSLYGLFDIVRCRIFEEQLASPESQRCELETRLSRRLTCRASAEPLCFGIVSALKCDPVHVLDAGRPTALARMEQA